MVFLRIWMLSLDLVSVFFGFGWFFFGSGFNFSSDRFFSGIRFFLQVQDLGILVFSQDSDLKFKV